MAPEQAKGRTADKRSDVWSFGCVLFEMLTRRRAFEGEDVSDTLATVLKSDPEWALLPADLSPSIRALVEGCLKKDRKHRISDMSTVRFLSTAPSGPVGGSSGCSARAPRRGESRSILRLQRLPPLSPPRSRPRVAAPCTRWRGLRCRCPASSSSWRRIARTSPFRPTALKSRSP
jgi:serine/threonine protein kinase